MAAPKRSLGRDVHDVFSTSAPAPKSMLAERFGSSGKYSVVELEKPVPAGLRSAKPEMKLEPGVKVKVIGRYGLGELIEKVEDTSKSSWRILFEDGMEGIILADRITTDLTVPEEAPKADNRTLYERLKEQKDAKQEEWEHKHTFKNQMDHWRLDEDDAAFEDERVERLRAEAAQQRAEADEDLTRYRAAMAVKTRSVELDTSALLAPIIAPAAPAQEVQAAVKRKPAFPTAPVGLKVKPVTKKAREDAAAVLGSSPTQPSPPLPQPTEGDNPAGQNAKQAACVLPGMAAYDDDDDDGESQ